MTVTWVENRVFSSRTYLLEEPGEAAWLVDCGCWERLLAQTGREVALQGVLLTHAHYDHIYGLPSLLARWPECRIFTNAAGVAALASPKGNMSRYHEDPISITGENILVVGEGGRIPLFPGVEAEVFETPGHHPSCLTYQVGERLFTGDAYIPGEKVVTTLPGGNKALAAESLARILSMTEGRELYAGHEPRKTKNTI